MTPVEPWQGGKLNLVPLKWKIMINSIKINISVASPPLSTTSLFVWNTLVLPWATSATTFPGKSAITVTAREVGIPACSASGLVTTKNVLVEKESIKSNQKEINSFKKNTWMCVDVSYLDDFCAETSGVDQITPNLTIRLQMSSMAPVLPLSHTVN